MASVNKVILIGTLGKDPESRYTAGGDAVCNFSVATTESWKDKSTGEKKEETEWHRVSVFGKLAEICGQYLKKGSQVYVEGARKTRKWTDKDGQERYTTEIRCNQMTVLGGKPSDGASQPGGHQQRSAPDSRQEYPHSGNNPKPSFDDLGDDMPFN